MAEDTLFEKPKHRAEVRELQITHMDFEADPVSIVVTERGQLGEQDPKLGVFHPEGDACIEDFLEGEVCRWSFFHAEFQYIIKGRAKLTYTLAPWHDETKVVEVGPGDAYMVPMGADIIFDVYPGAPFRKFCVTMPSEASYKMVPCKQIMTPAEYYKNKKKAKK